MPHLGSTPLERANANPLLQDEVPTHGRNSQIAVLQIHITILWEQLFLPVTAALSSACR
jgi:hypothetical protein